MHIVAAGLLVAHAAFWCLAGLRVPDRIAFGIAALILVVAIGVWRNRPWARAGAAVLAIGVPCAWIAYVMGGLEPAWRAPFGVTVLATLFRYAPALVPTALGIGLSLLARRGPSPIQRPGEPDTGFASRQLARIFISCAAIAEIWSFVAFRLSPPTPSAGIALIMRTVENAVPFLLAGAAAAICGYFQTARPRGGARLGELGALVVVGVALLLPVVYVVSLV